LQIYFRYPLSLILSLFGHNFCSWAAIEKNIYSHKAHSLFLSSKKIQKIITKIQPKIPFVPQTENGPSGVNLEFKKNYLSIYFENGPH